MHICSSIAKFSAPLLNTFVTHKVWYIHCTHSAMNFSCAMAFSLQKTDHCANLALAGSSYSSAHVNMLIAQWELSAMPGCVVWDEAIVCCSVLCQCQVAIFTGLPTLAHRTLISEYASCVYIYIYIYIYTHTRICIHTHSIDPSVCHVVFGYKTSHNAMVLGMKTANCFM
jgi:hypothetical protein